MNPDRTGRLAMLLAVRELRRSIARGRPMTLPNLLRLARRHSLADTPHLSRLRQLYLDHQPFRDHCINVDDCWKL